MFGQFRPTLPLPACLPDSKGMSGPSLLGNNSGLDTTHLYLLNKMPNKLFINLWVRDPLEKLNAFDGLNLITHGSSHLITMSMDRYVAMTVFLPSGSRRMPNFIYINDCSHWNRSCPIRIVEERNTHTYMLLYARLNRLYSLL